MYKIYITLRVIFYLFLLSFVYIICARTSDFELDVFIVWSIIIAIFIFSGTKTKEEYYDKSYKTNNYNRPLNNALNDFVKINSENSLSDLQEKLDDINREIDELTYEKNRLKVKNTLFDGGTDSSTIRDNQREYEYLDNKISMLEMDKRTIEAKINYHRNLIK